MTTVGDRSAGFTIIETLIVLAVSGMLAVSAMVMISGRQNKTQFQVAATSMQQQLEQLINETANGFYPSNSDFTCNGNNSPVTITNSAVVVPQGTNSRCIFLGKAVAFGVGATGADAESFIVYPLVANRYISGTTTEVYNFIQAKPQALAPSIATPDIVNYETQYKTKSGLKLHHAQYKESGNPVPLQSSNYAVFALANQLGQYQAKSASDGILSSATQKLDLFEMDKLPDWELPPSVPASSKMVVTHINARGIDESKVIEYLQLCFTSGGTNQSALLTISGRGQLAVTLKIYGKIDCTV